MAVHRGLQSVIFWYVSCAPCTERKYRKQRKQEVERGRLEREQWAVEMPDFYPHPAPSATNPHWQHEIDAGPVLVGRRWKGHSEDPRKKRAKTGTTIRSNGSDRPSSLDLSSNGESRDGRMDSKFDLKQAQRDDDELWGSTSTERLGFSRSWQSGGVTVPPRAHTRSSDSKAGYASLRNPQINDMHPATVTKVNSGGDIQWMFQPLPSADVMVGKARAPRSRSGSAKSSKLSAKANGSLPRDLSHGVVERRIRTGEMSLLPATARDVPTLAEDDPTSEQLDPMQTDARDFAGGVLKQSVSSKPGPSDASDDSTGSAVTVLRPHSSAQEPLERPENRRMASAPGLPTIVSDTTASASQLKTTPPSSTTKENRRSDHSNPSTNERDRVSRRSALVAKDDSLRVLQELAPSSRIFKTQVISPDELVRASKKGASSRMSSQDRAKDRAAQDLDPEIFASWETTDFALPEWIHEHTKREVKERWSMDI